MKVFKKLLAISLLSVLSACGPKLNLDGLTPEEAHGVQYVADHLERGCTIESFETVKGPMTPVLMSDEYKGYRDKIYKAGLDYKSCQTRGIQQGMDKAMQTIAEAQQEIRTKIAEWRQEQGSSEFIFVMSSIKRNGSIIKQIDVFNPATGQHDFTMPLTKPVVNNAAMILNAEKGTLFQYAIGADDAMTAEEVDNSNPVVKFILSADPETVR